MAGLVAALIGAGAVSAAGAALAFLAARGGLSSSGRLLIGVLTFLLLAMSLSEAYDVWSMGAARPHSFIYACLSMAAGVLAWRLLPKALAAPIAGAALAENRLLQGRLQQALAQESAARQRLEAALEDAQFTLTVQDLDMRYTWVSNPRVSPEAQGLIGKLDTEVLPPEVAEAVVPVRRRVMETGKPETTHCALCDRSKKEPMRRLRVRVSAKRDLGGRIIGVISSVVDVTAEHEARERLTQLAEEAAHERRRFEVAIDESPITVFEQDKDLRYTFIYNPPPGASEADYIGRADADLFPSEALEILRPLKAQALEQGLRAVGAISLEIGGARRHYELAVEPLDRGAGGGPIIGMAIDLTERVRSEERTRLLMRELTHRSKNLLAVIQAMARQSAAKAQDPKSFLEEFSARLRAMAASHDLLVSQNWTGASLKDLLQAHLDQIASGREQVILEGPPVLLGAETAQALGLGLHELTTNAAKYGALSGESGRVVVQWAREGGRVRLTWREEGGPPVVAPKRRGFGRTLLEQSVGASLSGSVTLDFAPEGLRCEIIFPDARGA